jgi:hypothetical protein
MSELERDLERWLREKLFTLTQDAFMRCDAAGVDAGVVITPLAVELAARCLCHAPISPNDAGRMLAGAITLLRQGHADRAQPVDSSR